MNYVEGNYYIDKSGDLLKLLRIGYQPRLLHLESIKYQLIVMVEWEYELTPVSRLMEALF